MLTDTEINGIFQKGYKVWNNDFAYLSEPLRKSLAYPAFRAGITQSFAKLRNRRGTQSVKREIKNAK